MLSLSLPVEHVTFAYAPAADGAQRDLIWKPCSQCRFALEARPKADCTMLSKFRCRLLLARITVYFGFDPLY